MMRMIASAQAVNIYALALVISKGKAAHQCLLPGKAAIGADRRGKEKARGAHN